MKKLIILLYMFIFIRTVSFSQPLGWTEQSASPAPPKLNCVGTYNIYTQPIAGWIGGNNGTILFTSNGGTNWLYRTSSLVGTNNINTIEALNATSALCSFTNSTATYLLKTTDTGLNWQIIFQQPNGYIRSIKMSYNANGFNPTTGYAIGDPVGGRWTLLRTTNSGASFDSAGLYIPQSGNELGLMNSLCIFYQYTMFGTNNYRIYRTTNSGVNWSSVNMPYQNIASIAFTMMLGTTYHNCFSGGSMTAKSTDWGITWQLVTLPGSGNCNSFIYDNWYSNWYSKGAEIYRSANYGQNFVLDYTSPNGGTYTDMCIRTAVFEGGTTAGWAVKDNGSISKYYDSFISVRKTSEETPNHFSLSQNYPNPFNPSTKIRFSLPFPSKGGVKLEVYDVLGRLVVSLIPPLWGGQEGLKSGTYEVEWDGSNYPSGVYYYRLSGGNFTQTRKMILIK
jgi:hypothetical protein